MYCTTCETAQRQCVQSVRLKQSTEVGSILSIMSIQTQFHGLGLVLLEDTQLPGPAMERTGTPG
jgi:hypothetical protein